MNKIVLFLFLVVLVDGVNALAKTLTDLDGIKTYPLKHVISTPNSIVWSYHDKTFNASEPLPILTSKALKTSKDFALVNLSRNSFSKMYHDKNFYNLKIGWNKFSTPKDGIDVIKTFTNNEIKFVLTYDVSSKAWAGYSPNKEIQKEIRSTRILSLQYIEPNVIFYVYSQKIQTIGTVSTSLSQSCLDKIDNTKISTLLDSGINKDNIKNSTKSIYLQSKYMSHYKSGIYNDSRVLLIYPKLDKVTSKNLLRYGPANPRVMLHYAKEYEGKEFYIFDYLKKQCYRGLFPSMKIPPFSNLSKI
jgi:hypothetical protein